MAEYSINSGAAVSLPARSQVRLRYKIVHVHALAALLFFLAQPFWEAKPPEQWTDAEVESVLHYSPWTQAVGPSPEVLVWFATARPIEEAESEARLRKKNPLREPDPDYLDFLRENRDHCFVLAIAYPDWAALSKAADLKNLEAETKMTAGGKSYGILGYFPPSSFDPVLRLVFPREVRPLDKSVGFQLFLPGLPFPEREAQFRVRDLSYHGKLTM